MAKQEDWSTDWSLDKLQDATEFTDHTKLPWQCWVMVKMSVLLYLRREHFYGGKGIFLDVNSGEFYEAETIMQQIPKVKMLHMKSVKMIGDNRPVFDTEEEQAAYEATQP